MDGDTPDRTPSGGSQPHIIIPHSHADRGFASRLTVALRQDRITPWVDVVDMSAGVILVDWIANAGRPVDCVIPAISAASVWSNWVQQELKAVITGSLGGRRSMVLPAKIDDSALPDFLACRPHLDFFGKGWDSGYEDLLITVQLNTGGPRPPRGEQPGIGLPPPTRLTYSVA